MNSASSSKDLSDVTPTAVPSLTTPSTLTLHQSHKLISQVKEFHLRMNSLGQVNEACYYSVHHHSITGDILVGGKDGMKIISRQSGEITHLADYTFALITEHKGEAFMTSSDALPAGDEQKIYVFKFYIETGIGDLLFSYKSIRDPYIGVSALHIVYLGENSYINLYNRETGTVSRTQLPDKSEIYRLECLPDNHILVILHNTTRQNTLNNYRLNETGELTLIWSCDGLEDACSLSLADNGIIFVCGFCNRIIYTVNNEGMLIRQITCSELPEYCLDISVQRDELAVAGNDRGVFIYKMV